MRERRFFHPGQLKEGTETSLTGEEFKHVKVLRLSRGATVTLFDGQGHEAKGVVVDITRDRATVKIEEVWKVKRDAPNIILACSPVKANRMDFLLEKSCELGASEVWPTIFERTVIKLAKADWPKKKIRWQRILISAAKQSKRTDVPIILEPTELRNIKSRLKGDDLLLLCDQSGQHPLEIAIRQAKRIVIFVGPEGGLTEEEGQFILSLGAITMSLGTNVLRTETACVAALCMVFCATSASRRT